MDNKLVFSEIKKDNIFCSFFQNFTTNNEIEFSKNGIAVLYGPNGTGKTSLTRILNCEDKTSFKLEYDGKAYNQSKNELFHIINDQNSRNIIEGKTEDFLLGDNIRREYELKEILDLEFKRIFETDLSNSLKNDFQISKITSKLLDAISDEKLKTYLKDIANSKSKGKGINRDEFIEFIKTLTIKENIGFDDLKLTFFKNNFDDSKSIIAKIIAIKESQIKKDEKIKLVEEHDEAIKILSRFSYKKECIVCDNDIESETLLKRKTENKESVFQALDEETKSILESIIKTIKSDDPFNIKNIFLDAIKEGNKAPVVELQQEIKLYFKVFDIQLNNFWVKYFELSELDKHNSEYKKILGSKPEMTDEDILYIEKVVNENIEKKIELRRDENKNLKLFLGEKELINQERDKLNLSNGEQNFISLAFELLKAKKIKDKIIVLDDPISSFDSIYKNKIAFSIIKFLEKKNQIILTHNTDLIRLLEHQKQKCFNLYMFNNTENEENGFIRINDKEQKILLYIDKLIDLFRNNIFNEIQDEKAFLISAIPFMRGYAQIVDSKEEKNKLTKLMHGYETEKVNITEVYNSLFDKAEKIKNKYEISAKDITEMNIDNIKVLKNENYPLLNKTLRHTLSYLYLRLNVEKTLVEKYSINTKKADMLSQIIFKAFETETPKDTEYKIFFTSRKTLLNEFNHFEGNMNIFQPAIDISDSALKKEKDDILNCLEKIKNE